MLCAVVAGIHVATFHSPAVTLCFGFFGVGALVLGVGGFLCCMGVCVSTHTRVRWGVFLWAKLPSWGEKPWESRFVVAPPSEE